MKYYLCSLRNVVLSHQPQELVSWFYAVIQLYLWFQLRMDLNHTDQQQLMLKIDLPKQVLTAKGSTL